MSTATTTVDVRIGNTQRGFILAWGFCVLFYFGQYALRSAPGVMMPELTGAFGTTAIAVSSLIGLYYYTYSVFAIVSGAALDHLGAKYVVPLGIVITASGAIVFGLGSSFDAEIGRLLQGAGSAFSFTGAVYLASHGFSSRYLATAVGFTQCFGMLGGSAGQFTVGPMIHGLISWQQFWIFSGIALLILATIICISTPAGHDRQPRKSGALLSMFKPYKTVLSNPQSYLCGLSAGLLFLPTTIGDMIWGMPFLREGLGVDYADAVNRVTMVPLGWVVGCPLLGYIADKLGRRKPVLIGGALLMLAALAATVYLPHAMPHYLLGLLLGIGSGAAMIPYTIIKEVNPDKVKGSATGAINFLVFTLSAVLAPAYGWLLNLLSGGKPLTLGVFQDASAVGIAGIVLAIVLSFFLQETGTARRPAAPVTQAKGSNT
ncbi:MFS transporter [Telmatospirillum siberiense]|uniref:Lysosomal dipeptide transporter MFSD1 n=1 Tax=Telmatospirillum siberiense TaxID=382514 RepID=A0A2N3PRK5_9PROT|nr:MFS transporter [Telmatospirillum siberiense]PKU23038.1 MFS transporter [Telmatospirillum siberiense]